MPKIAEGLWDGSGQDLRLIGGRCRSTGTYVFPFPTGGAADLFERVSLHRQGTLWSFTTQKFPPKTPPYVGETSPEAFVPFAVGYVELPGQVIVESRLVDVDVSDLAIGMAMELVTEDFAVDGSGRPLTTFAFQPSAWEAGA
ncbi:MAG: OB-fold domain-containing protein [Pseudomonadota bacterium]